MNVFIIAEAGVNHNGSMELALRMIDAAKEAGADAVKFQTFKAEKLVTRSAAKADYQKEATGGQESQFDMIKKLELDAEKHIKLIEYCKTKKIMFMSTPFDNDSVAMLDSLGLEVFKIPSGEITNLPYLRSIGRLNKKVVLSTGMSYMHEIEDAVNVLVAEGTERDRITVLHANTEYPTPMEDVNLRAMVSIGRALGLRYGYSDHTLGFEVDVAAVAMGATVIEKHFTLDKNMEGPDHKASLEPQELKSMVSAIRNIELAMGDGVKKPSQSESKNIAVARKSIVAGAYIKSGELFSEANLTVKRPGTGISPMRWDDIIGNAADRDYKPDELIQEEG